MEKRVLHLPDHPPIEAHCPHAHKVQQYCGTWWKYDSSLGIVTIADANDACDYGRALYSVCGEGKRCKEIICQTHGHLLF